MEVGLITNHFEKSVHQICVYMASSNIILIEHKIQKNKIMIIVDILGGIVQGKSLGCGPRLGCRVISTKE